MLMLVSLSRCRYGARLAILALRYLVMAGILSSCATENPSRGAAQTASECSFFGRAACHTMAMGSGAQGTCRVAGGGTTRVEVCGTAATTVAGSVRLSWQDNSTDESGFVIERCDQIDKDAGTPNSPASCRGTWNRVGNVAANTTVYVDDTVTANRTYFYRVKATNPSGSSGYTAEAVITAAVK